jgi:hypothetical protein
MKTKVLFLFSFIALLVIITSCKKKEIVVVPPPPLPITEQEYVLTLKAIADHAGLTEDDKLSVPVDSNVIPHNASLAIVSVFKEDWTYTELKPVLKEIPLSVVWVGKSGAKLLIENYEDFVTNYKQWENFQVLEPRPVYNVIIGENQYWLTKEGGIWNTREMIILKKDAYSVFF